MGNYWILAAPAKSSSGSGYFYLLIFVGLLALMYFFMIRPQRNRQRQVMQAQNQLVPGLRVRTTAGIYGKLTSVDRADVTLEVAPGVEIRILRRAIMEVIHNDSQASAAGPAGDSAEEAGAGTGNPAKGAPAAAEDEEHRAG